MPLQKGPKAKGKGMSANIRTLMHEGRPQPQAVAIAYRLAGEKKRKGK